MHTGTTGPTRAARPKPLSFHAWRSFTIVSTGLGVLQGFFGGTWYSMIECYVQLTLTERRQRNMVLTPPRHRRSPLENPVDNV